MAGIEACLSLCRPLHFDLSAPHADAGLRRLVIAAVTSCPFAVRKRPARLALLAGVPTHFEIGGSCDTHIPPARAT